MGKTNIEWTRGADGQPGMVWNPTTGCDRVTPGCDNCYALTMAGRLKGMGQAKYQTDGDPRTSGPGFGLAVHDDALSVPLRWKKPRLIFVNSMSDLFHPNVPDAFIAQVWRVMAATPRHTYQILTKRHGRMRSLLNSNEFFLRVDLPVDLDIPWPLPNVWLGVSSEDQQRAELRIPALLDTPAAVHFLSCEPLLTAVDLSRFMTLAPRGDKSWCSTANRFIDRVDSCGCRSSHAGTYGHRIDWVIVGGESGAVTRPMNPDWVRALRDQATTARVPFLFKQWGGRTPKAGGRELDGREWNEFPDGPRP